MINITEQNKSQCCGCNACGDACAKHAITFKTDIEGFWYPEVNKDLCTDCGLCDKMCPIINIGTLKKNEFSEPKCFAAVHKNLEVRFDSTSGGLFTAFAEQILKEGGVVGGAQYTDDLYVEQVLISDKAELYKLRGSKYIQSDFNGFYKAVKNALLEGKKVLLCGSPCQMAAVRSFLRKPYDNLYIMDYVCRGIPSGMIFHKYLEYWEKKKNSKAVYFKFKIKDLGWRKRTMKIGFKDGSYVYDDCDNSLYDLGYHNTHAFCRPSCHDCKFKGFPRIADVTVADFWGIEKHNNNPELDRNMGTSLVMCNNNKGLELYGKLKQKIVSAESTLEIAINGNPALVESHPAPVVERDDFYKRIQSEDFESVINDIIEKGRRKPTLKSQIKKSLKTYYKSLKLIKQVLTSGLTSTCQYFKYNTLRNIIEGSAVLLPYKNTVLDIHKTAKINVEKGTLRIGHKHIKGSNLETRILMERNSILNVKGDYVMYYGGDVEIFEGGNLSLGEGSGFNLNCNIICADKITIGDHVAMGRNVTIRDNNGGHYISRQGYKNARPVVIEDHAWLCEGCTIMPGVKVGTGAIVGAGAIVYSNVPPFTMVSGNPAKVVDTDICWKS